MKGLSELVVKLEEMVTTEVGLSLELELMSVLVSMLVRMLILEELEEEMGITDEGVEVVLLALLVLAVVVVQEAVLNGLQPLPGKPPGG